MIFDTLEYVDALGATQEVALKLANVSTQGCVRMELSARSHAPSELHLTWNEPPENTFAIPFKSRCIVRASRTSATGAANTFSGGTILFQGRRTDNEGSVGGAHVRSNITLSDALWDLSKITYQLTWRYPSGGTIAAPTYSDFLWPDVCLFATVPGVTYSPAAVNGTISSWQQIKAIVDYAIAYASGANAVDLQIGSSAEFQPLYVNWYPVRSMKCSECLNICLRPHPGVFTEVDHSTEPPTIHFRNRANLTAVTLPYKSTLVDGTRHIATDIQPLPELVPDAVRLYYKITGTFNGNPSISYATDFYPPGAANSLLCHDYSIDLLGATVRNTYSVVNCWAFDPTSKALWREKVPALKQVAEGGQIPNDATTGALEFVSTSAYDPVSNPKGIQVIDETGAVINTATYQYITEDDLFTWMDVGGSPVLATTATVKAFFTYNKVSSIAGTTVTDSMKEHEHHFRVLLTNAPSDTYVLNQTLATGESMPSGLAQYIYTELADLQWKLRHEIIQVAANTTDLPTLIKPGKHKVNLSGGHADWTTMNAVAEAVQIQFFRSGDGKLVAQHSINCGPVNHLEPGYLVQLSNLFINRNRSGIDANQRLTGSLGSSEVNLTAEAARENSTAAAPVPEVSNFVYETGGVVAGQVIVSAKKISDLLVAAGTNTNADAAVPKQVLTPITMGPVIHNGVTGNVIVLASGGFTSSPALTPTLQLAGTGGSGNRACFRFKDEFGDFLRCVTWDGSTEGAKILTAVVVAGGGTGYTVGDVLTLAGGTGTAATITVSAVSGGVITAVTITSVGSYTVAPTSPNSATGGTGSGATFTVTVDNYVYIAKPWKLRRSLTSAVIYGTTWNYTFSGSYGTTAPVIRACAASGFTTLNEAISPPYLPNDVIYADTLSDSADYSLETGTTTANHPVTLVDLNQDGRAWATQS